MTAASRELKGRHVLAAVLGFFGVVMAVNGIFVWLALGSFSGVEAPHPYRTGLHYNEELARAAAQAALGWQAEAAVASEAGETTAQLTLRDAEGRPIDGLSVTAIWRRPTQAAWDREVAMQPSGPGRYAATLALPAAGQWDLRLIAQDPARGSFRLDRRVMVR